MIHALNGFLARFPFAWLAIGLLVTVSGWHTNMNRVPYEDALPTLIFIIGLSFSVMALLRLCMKSWIAASLTMLIASVYIFYAPLALRLVTQNSWVTAGALFVLGLIALDIARRLPRDRAALETLNLSANRVLLPVVLLFCGIALYKQIELSAQRPDMELAFTPFKGHATAESPDVWHLIFDRYASNETLKRVYNYDNQTFEDALSARGFDVQRHAFSNYQRTAHSVASTLNGAYLDGLSKHMTKAPGDWVPLYRAMTDNAALRFFNEQGYQTFFAGSWWNPTRRSLTAGHNINYRALPELGRLILEQSVFGFILQRAELSYGDARQEQCQRVGYKFGALQVLAANHTRKYVFAHFLVPHPPFVINYDGSCRSLEQANGASRRDNYIGQLIYANGQILELIDRIQAGPRPAIIILHADEGPWPKPYVGDERFIGRDPVAVNWSTLSNRQLQEKMGILLAIHTPQRMATAMPQTPVNIYPSLLQQYFSGSNKSLPNKHYVFERAEALYTFREVSGRLGAP